VTAPKRRVVVHQRRAFGEYSSRVRTCSGADESDESDQGDPDVGQTGWYIVTIGVRAQPKEAL
jgi:hypothetical protein